MVRQRRTIIALPARQRRQYLFEGIRKKYTNLLYCKNRLIIAITLIHLISFFRIYRLSVAVTLVHLGSFYRVYRLTVTIALIHLISPYRVYGLTVTVSLIYLLTFYRTFQAYI